MNEASSVQRAQMVTRQPFSVELMWFFARVVLATLLGSAITAALFFPMAGLLVLLIPATSAEQSTYIIFIVVALVEITTPYLVFSRMRQTPGLWATHGWRRGLLIALGIFLSLVVIPFVISLISAVT